MCHKPYGVAGHHRTVCVLSLTDTLTFVSPCFRLFRRRKVVARFNSKGNPMRTTKSPRKRRDRRHTTGTLKVRNQKPQDSFRTEICNIVIWTCELSFKLDGRDAWALRKKCVAVAGSRWSCRKKIALWVWGGRGEIFRRHPHKCRFYFVRAR